MTPRPERLLKKSIRGLRAFRADAPAGLRMDTNANLLGANPVVTRFFGQFDPLELNDYPSPHSDLLRKRLSQRYGLSPEQFIAGNGADELLDLVLKSFIDPGDRVVFPDPSFGIYDVLGRANSASVIRVPLKEGWELDVEGLLLARATVAIVCTPNNPTGNSFSEDAIQRLMAEFKGILVLDEAYAEYAGKSHLGLVDRFPNLVVLRTFSKAFGLAGLRVGYAAASRPLAAQLYKAKTPYNLGTIGEGIAAAALLEKKFLDSVVRRISRERAKMGPRLEELGFLVYPSETNFLLAKSPMPSKTLCRRLEKRGIVIKDLGDHPRLKDHVRITLGRPDQNERLLRAMRRALGR
ncbi:MAG: histidinol-phosphate transaminase [Thermoplasmatota archaeon]